MAWERVEIPKLQACRRCGYVACVCTFKAEHAETCQRRRACLDDHPTPCKAHDIYACADCFPCDCKAAGALERSAAE